MRIIAISPPPVKTYLKPRRRPQGHRFGAGLLAPVLEIKGMPYEVSAIAPGEDHTQAVRLTKLAGDGAIYDVVRTWYGTVECDCPDFCFRRKGLTLTPCKHGRKLIDVGLIAAPAVDPAPAGPDWDTLAVEDACRQRYERGLCC